MMPRGTRLRPWVITGAILGLTMLAFGCGSGAPATKPAGETKPAAPASTAPPATSQAKPAETKPAQPAAPVPKPLTTVKSGYVSGGGTEWAVFLASGMGYFEEQGIKMEFISFQNAGDQIPALANGDIDVGGGSDSAAFFNALARGIDVRIVADKGITMPGVDYQGLVIRQDLIDSGRVKDYKDLKGLKIALSGKGVTTEYMLDHALRKAGMTLKDVETVTMRFPDMFAALTNKSVAGAILSGSWVDQAKEKKIGAMFKGAYDFSPGHHISLIMYAPKFIQERPDVARAWMVAYMKGVRKYTDAFVNKQDMDAAIAAIGKHVDARELQIAKTMTPVTIDPNLEPNPVTIAKDQDWYAEHDYVKTKSDLNKAIDISFAKYAQSQLGRK